MGKSSGQNGGKKHAAGAQHDGGIGGGNVAADQFCVNLHQFAVEIIAFD